MYSFGTFSILSLVASLVYLFLGVYIWSKNPRSRTHVLFLSMALTMFLWGLGEGMMRAAINKDIALFWGVYMVGIGSALHNAILIHFIIAFTSQIRKTKSIPVFFIYIFPVAFLLLRFFAPQLFSFELELNYWGYSLSGNGLYGIYMLMVSLYAVAATVLGFRAAKKITGGMKKNVRNMSFGILFVVILGVSTQVSKSVITLPLPEFTVISTFLFTILVAHAIIKYKAFTITVTGIAENIVATMYDFVIAVDGHMQVKFVNDSVLDILGYSLKEVLDKPVRQLFSKQTSLLEHEKFAEKKLWKDQSLTLLSKSGETIPISANISTLKISNEQISGLVFVCRDMREINQLMEDLQKQQETLAKTNEELKQFNEFAVGRENKMVELKQRIKELERQAEEG